MKTIEEMKAEIRSLTKEGKELLEADNPTKEAVVRSKEIMNEIAALEAEVEKQVELEEARANLEAQEARNNKPAERKVAPAQVETADRTPKIVVGGSDSKYFRNNREAYEVGMWAAATFAGNKKAQRWINDYAPQYETRAQSVSVDSAVVPTPLSSAIINLVKEYSVFPKLARNYPMTSNTLDIPRRGRHTTAYWTNEEASTTESQTSWNQVQLQANKLSGRTVFSREIVEDAVIDIMDFVVEDISSEMSKKIDEQGFNGTGSPFTGITTAIEADSGLDSHVTISTINTLAEVTNTHLTTLMSGLPSYARRNAKWICSREAADQVFGRLKAAGGGHTTQTLSGGLGDQYLGYEIVISDVMPYAADLDGQVMLMFGDMSQSSAFSVRSGLDFIVDPYSKAQTGQIVITAHQRVALNNHSLGNDHDDSPVQALVGSAS